MGYSSLWRAGLFFDIKGKSSEEIDAVKNEKNGDDDFGNHLAVPIVGAGARADNFIFLRGVHGE